MPLANGPQRGLEHRGRGRRVGPDGRHRLASSGADVTSTFCWVARRKRSALEKEASTFRYLPLRPFRSRARGEPAAMSANTLSRDHLDLDSRLGELAERRARSSTKVHRRDAHDTILPTRRQRARGRAKPQHRARAARLVTVALSSSAFVAIVSLLGMRGTSPSNRMLQSRSMQIAARYGWRTYTPAGLHTRADTSPTPPACTGSKC